MGTFACIEFTENKILVPKISYESIHYLGIDGYMVYLIKPPKEMVGKEWKALEKRLLALDVEYVIVDRPNNPFENLMKVDGQSIKFYLAPYLLKYIYKYKLIPKKSLDATIGIIPGRIEETLAVVTGIMNEIAALTFYVDIPPSYAEILKEIYSKSRLSAKAKVPCSLNLREADIIFDLSGGKNYIKWCKPSAIYIDYKNTTQGKKMTFDNIPPSIWNDFDIICGRQLIRLDILQAILHVQGIYKRGYHTALKRLDTRIQTVYKVGIS